MSRELKDSLAYDYNYNLFLAKSMLPNVRNIDDRQTVVKWLRFLKSRAKSIDEMKLRNDFMYYLVLNVQEGVLKSPFDKPPPKLPLETMAPLLVPYHLSNTIADANLTPAKPMSKQIQQVQKDLLLRQEKDLKSCADLPMVASFYSANRFLTLVLFVTSQS